jgi:thymidylate synthase
MTEKPGEYTAKYKPTQLIQGTGQTALITGWTIKEAVQKHLSNHEYAVIGQLYSPTRGINLVVRNLLLNPHVRYLVILNGTKEDKNAGGCQCLADFFRYGFNKGISDIGRKTWVISSSITGYIDIEIDMNVLEKLRESVEIKEVQSIAQAVKAVRDYATKKPVAPWGMPLEFPMSTIESNTLPGPLYGHRIEGKTIAETWVKIIHRIKTTGVIRPTSHDGTWQELIDLMAIITNEPDDFYFPEPNYLPVDRSFLQEYISQILEDAPSQEGIKYTYGQRLRSWFGKDQVQQVIEKLTHDINSARAVMSLWDIKEDHDESNPPCLNHIWVRVVSGELSLTATFRSNDMFSAWPANAMGLRALQKYIYSALLSSHQSLKLGPLITISQSAHIYDDCFENVSKVISSQYGKIAKNQDYSDPVGNFIISNQEGKVVVEHTTPGSGEVVNCYSNKSAYKVSQEIMRDCPGLQNSHAMYLGWELCKLLAIRSAPKSVSP